MAPRVPSFRIFRTACSGALILYRGFHTATAGKTPASTALQIPRDLRAGQQVEPEGMAAEKADMRGFGACFAGHCGALPPQLHLHCQDRGHLGNNRHCHGPHPDQAEAAEPRCSDSQERPGEGVGIGIELAMDRPKGRGTKQRCACRFFRCCAGEGTPKDVTSSGCYLASCRPLLICSSFCIALPPDTPSHMPPPHSAVFCARLELQQHHVAVAYSWLTHRPLSRLSRSTLPCRCRGAEGWVVSSPCPFCAGAKDLPLQVRCEGGGHLGLYRHSLQVHCLDCQGPEPQLS
jgi:hypothetical protein